MPREPKVKSSVNMQKNRNKVVGAEPATVLKVQEAAKMITEGKSRATIIETLQDKYGIGYDQAKHLYGAGIRFLIPEDEDKYRKELIVKNIARLETIIENSMTDRQWKIAREAIDSLNKMIGIGNGGFQVAVNTDKENNTQQIYIKFD